MLSTTFMKQIPNNAIRQVLILATIITLGIILFNQLKTLIPAFLGAYTLYVLLRKWMFILQGRYKWKKTLTAAMLMLLSFLIILLPILLVINMLTSKIAFAMEHSQEVLNSLQTYITKIESQYKIRILTDANLEKITTWGSNTVPKILASTFDTILSIVIMYFILYFMLVDGRHLLASIAPRNPVAREGGRSGSRSSSARQREHRETRNHDTHHRSNNQSQHYRRCRLPPGPLLDRRRERRAQKPPERSLCQGAEGRGHIRVCRRGHRQDIF
jgi:hypothetical protein